VAVIDALCERIIQWGYELVAHNDGGTTNNVICREAGKPVYNTRVRCE